MSNSTRITEMERRLNAALAPELLEIEDESDQHAGHAGAKDGKGHFAVTLVSDAFNGKSLIQRHRLVYDALGELMQTDIHALSIKATAGDEL